MAEIGYSPPRRRPPPAGAARGFLLDGGYRVFPAATASTAGWGGVEIPDETVHSGGGGGARERVDPVSGDVEERIGRRGLIGTVEARQHFACGIQDVDRHRAGGGGLQVVIDDGAIGRVLSAGLFGRQRRIGVGIARAAGGGAGFAE